jgi:hypothetical protein
MKRYQKGVVLLPIVIIVVLLLVVGFFFYQNFQSANQQAQLNQERSDRALATVTPPPETNEDVNTVTPAVYERTFKYMDFLMGYPEDWTLLDMSTSDTFPLKERLSLYKSGKVVALNKEGIYLIVAIEKETEGGAGGIFLDDEHYNDFISDRDKVVIENSIFYLSRTHSAIDSLQESHGGPYGWSSLTEFVPSKSTPSGSYRGSEDVIKRNGHAFVFIVVSEKGGNTPTQIQEEIVSILETIEW